MPKITEIPIEIHDPEFIREHKLGKDPGAPAGFNPANLNKVFLHHHQEIGDPPLTPEQVEENDIAFPMLEKAFHHVLHESHGLLNAANKALATYQKNQTAANKTAYEKAAQAFNNFYDEMKEKEIWSDLFIDPIATRGGYFFGVRVRIRWKGGTHSSDHSISST